MNDERARLMSTIKCSYFGGTETVAYPLTASIITFTREYRPRCIVRRTAIELNVLGSIPVTVASI